MMNRWHRIVWLLAALAVAVAPVAACSSERPGSETPVPPAEEWVAVASVEEVEEAGYVLYVPEHELFVSRLSSLPEGFMALSAWTPPEEDGDEPRRMLHCTQSNHFENPHGDVYDWVGHEVEGRERLSRIPLRVRDGMVEVIPTRLDRNDLDGGNFAGGPPCGEWGDVVEGPPGYALATDAPAEENKATIRPARLKAGQRVKIHFAPAPQSSGLKWDLYRLEDNGLWRWQGIFVGGPGYKPYFDLSPLDSGGIDDVGIGGIYSINTRIPEELEPGTYRLATSSLKGGRKPVEERIVWHYADFEVIPD